MRGNRLGNTGPLSCLKFRTFRALGAQMASFADLFASNDALRFNDRSVVDRVRRFRDIDALDRLGAIAFLQQACPQVVQMPFQFACSLCLSILSMPGVRAPLDAIAIRAASASHSRVAISRRSQSNRRFESLSAHIASSYCISLIIKGLHLVMDFPHSRTTTGTPPTRWTSGATPLQRNTSLSFHHAFPRSYA